MSNLNNKTRNLNLLLLSSVAMLSTFAINPALSAPQGANVSVGSATINQSAGKTDIYQHTDKAILDWNSFDIAAGEHTQFHQPSSSAIALNRIHDVKASQIDGTLTANGHIMLINPNGVVFGAGAQVDVAALTVTSSDIHNDDFMSAHYAFNDVGQEGAKIINHGRITAAEAGLVTLVAPDVQNHGVIMAKLGKVELASADKFTLDLAGDGLIQVAISESDAAKLVRNTGKITAQSGRIAMTAGQARNLVDTLIDNSGVLEAASLTAKGGKITLAAAQGTVKHSGVIKADGLTGGDVQILGDNVGLFDNASVDVSGSNGGGSIKIGGDIQGQGETQTARVTYIDRDVTLNADAINQGDGGEIIVWADHTTRYYGELSATGGAQNGNGGFAEVSGKRYLDYNGDADLSGATLGTLLLDPDDLDIVSGSANPADFADDTLAFAENSGATSTLGADIISTRLSANAHVTLQAQNTIDVDAAITSTGDGNLRLETGTGGTLTINQAIDVNTGDLTLEADEIDINAALSGSGSIYMQTASSAQEFEIGSTNAAALNLTATELANLQEGWGSIILSDSANTGDFLLSDNVSFSDHTEIRSRGATFTTNAALSTTDNANLIINRAWAIPGTITLNSDLNIAGDLSFQAIRTLNFNADVTVGGALTTNGTSGVNVDGNVVADSIDFYSSHGWVRIFDGHSVQTTNDMALRAGTSGYHGNRHVRMYSNSSIHAGGALNIITHLINIDSTASISGTGDLTFQARDATAAMELGSSSAGHNWRMITAELDTIQDGFNSITFGSATHAADIDFTAATSFHDTVIIRQDASASDVDVRLDHDITLTEGNLEIYGATADNAGASTSTVFVGGNLDIAGNFVLEGRGVDVEGTGSETLNVGGDLTFTPHVASNAKFENYDSVSTGGNFTYTLEAREINTINNFTIGGDLLGGQGANAADTGFQNIGTLNVSGDVNLNAGNARLGFGATDANITGNLILTSSSANLGNDLDSNNVEANALNLFGDIDVGGNVTLTATHAQGAVANFGALQANGDMTLIGSGVNLRSGSNITGNADGSSQLTFREYGDDHAMELGGTSAGHTWQMTSAELATLQDGFNSITFGSAAHAADIEISGATTLHDDTVFLQDTNQATRIDIDADLTVHGDLSLTGGQGYSDVEHADNTMSIVFYDEATLIVDGDLALNTSATRQFGADGNFLRFDVGGDFDSRNVDGTLSATTLNIGGNYYEDERLYATNLTVGGDLHLTSDIFSVTTGQINGHFYHTSALNPDYQVGTLTIAQNMVVDALGSRVQLSSGARNFNIGGDLTISNASQISSGNAVEAQGNIQVDGDVNLESASIYLNSSGFQLAGNADGSSQLTFREYGDDHAMELGGTSAGHTWQMTSAELATLQDGFNSITFGSATHAADIDVTGAVTLDDMLTLYTAYDINVGDVITTNESGNSLTLVADNVTNTAGASALNPETGRYLVYVDTPDHVIRDGLNADSLYSRTYTSAPPSSLDLSLGSRFVFNSAEPAVASTENTNIVSLLSSSVLQQAQKIEPISFKFQATPFPNQGKFKTSRQDKGTKVVALDTTPSSNPYTAQPLIDLYALCSYSAEYCQ